MAEEFVFDLVKWSDSLSFDVIQLRMELTDKEEPYKIGILFRKIPCKFLTSLL